MTRDRAPAIGAALALASLAVLVLIDITVPPDYFVLTAMFGLPPLVACSVVPARGTAAIGGLSTVAAVLSGVWNETIGDPQHTVRVLNVALVSAAAIVILLLCILRIPDTVFHSATVQAVSARAAHRAFRAGDFPGRTPSGRADQRAAGCGRVNVISAISEGAPKRFGGPQ